MLIEAIPAELTGTNCYVVATGPREQCLIIDPGYGVTAAIDEVVAHHRLHPIAVLITHGHLDHTFSVLPVCQARDVPAWIHPADRPALTDPWTGLGLPIGAPIFGSGGLTFAEPEDVRELVDGEPMSVAGLALAARHAPGHTEGSVVFNTPGGADQPPVMFAGDLLFAGSIGRTDLPGGNGNQMTTSLRTVILPCEDEMLVYPGHGPATTIGRERRTNPYLEGLEI